MDGVEAHAAAYVSFRHQEVEDQRLVREKRRRGADSGGLFGGDLSGENCPRDVRFRPRTGSESNMSKHLMPYDAL